MLDYEDRDNLGDADTSMSELQLCNLARKGLTVAWDARAVARG